MMNKLSINVFSTSHGLCQLQYEHSTFPGGEIFFRLDEPSIQHILMMHGNCEVVITAKIYDSQDLLRLIMAVDAIRGVSQTHGLDPLQINLKMPYVPYSRQDRICSPGESFSLSAFCKLINSMRLKSVEVFDPHSTVTTALLNSSYENMSAYENFIIDSVTHLGDTKFAAVSPDAGALKKVHGITKYLHKKCCIDGQIIVGAKVRDMSTGEILHTSVDRESLDGIDCVIFDDICDGGRTFVELARALKDRGAGRIGLVVSHGIFSKGLIPFVGLIDWVVSTDSWPEPQPLDGVDYRQINVFG
jgi:ribose-phosphate pyrophosphokinase